MPTLAKARLSPGVRRPGAIGNGRLVTAPVIKPPQKVRRGLPRKVSSVSKTPITRSTYSSPKGPRLAPPPRYNV